MGFLKREAGTGLRRQAVSGAARLQSARTSGQIKVKSRETNLPVDLTRDICIAFLGGSMSMEGVKMMWKNMSREAK